MKFECHKKCKKCYHGEEHTHTYMCDDANVNCPKCKPVKAGQKKRDDNFLTKGMPFSIKL